MAIIKILQHIWIPPDWSLSLPTSPECSGLKQKSYLKVQLNAELLNSPGT